MIFNLIAAIVVIYLVRRIFIRLQLSKAKHPSLRGHAKMSKRIARLLPHYSYGQDHLFKSDGAPLEIEAKRLAAFKILATELNAQSPETISKSNELLPSVSDVAFTARYRVPFQFSQYVSEHMPINLFAQASKGAEIQDLDGNWYYDLTGAYGVNLYGYDFYKECIDKGIAKTRTLGPVLGPYHPLIIDNVNRLKEISGQDEVSFHMSGTEAVMQAVRLAHYHTKRAKTVVFCGAYHGWWDGVQPGIGNPRKVSDVYTLKEMSNDTLRVLRNRKDIACVLINPLQALNPNGGANSDSMLVASDRSTNYDKKAYSDWLKTLRQVCTEKGIVLIMDEVFLGFRLAQGGAQEYFGVSADIVTYGKTLGGGLPVGVVCGKSKFMKRYREINPSDVCFARGTFNSHPYVMGAMHSFLEAIEQDEFHIDPLKTDVLWDARTQAMNERLSEAGIPLKMANMQSIWTPIYTRPSRYNWMLQFYLRAEGLYLPWIGTGRFIFSHNYNDDDFEQVMVRLLVASKRMLDDGWWWENPALSNKAIKRKVLKELLVKKWPWLPIKVENV